MDGVEHLGLVDDVGIDGAFGIEPLDYPVGIGSRTDFLHDGMNVVALLLGRDVGFGRVVEYGQLGKMGRCGRHQGQRQ